MPMIDFFKKSAGNIDIYKGALIDAHCHLRVPGNIEAALHLLQCMEENNVKKAFVFLLKPFGDKDVLASCSKFPGRLIPFVMGFNDYQEILKYKSGDNTEANMMLERIGKYLKGDDFGGIGETITRHYKGLVYDIKSWEISCNSLIMHKLLDIAEVYHCPINIHHEAEYYKEIDSLLLSHPNVPVIWAHCGGVRNMLGVGLIAELMARHTNLHVDISALDRFYTLKIANEISNDWPMRMLNDEGLLKQEWMDFLLTFSDRILFGTDLMTCDDYFNAGNIIGFYRYILGLLPHEAASKIGIKNAAGILSLRAIKNFKYCP